MQSILKLSALALSIAVLTTWQTASAQNIESIRDRLDRSELQGTQLASFGLRNSCDECGGGCDGGSCSSSGRTVYGGIELVIAKPYFEDGVNPSSNEPGYDFESSARFIAGFHKSNGLGARMRYWQWDHESNTPTPVTSPLNLDIQALDLELTKAVSLGSVDGTIYGGARYGKVEHRLVDLSDGMTFEGAGPTLGIDILTPIECVNLSVVGGLRYSAIFGHTRSFLDDREEDDVSTGFDARLGFQNSRSIRCGILTLSALVESQNWANASTNPGNVASESDEDLGFFGFTLGVEYVR